MKADEELRLLIRASYPLVYLVTWEEERCVNMLSKVAGDQRRSFYEWSTTTGLRKEDGKIEHPQLKDPNQLQVYLPALLSYLLNKQEPGALYVLKDFHHYIREPIITRLLRDIVSAFKSEKKTLVLLSPIMEIPVELEKDIHVLDYGLPDQNDLEQMTDEFLVEIKKANPSVEIDLSSQEKEKIIKAMMGLTQMEVENTLSKIIVRNKRLGPEDIPMILAEKEQIIKKSGILDFYASVDKFRDIGGLDELKDWLGVRAEAFSEKAKQMRLPAPKGIVLLGVPGCGKSLCAKAVASEWGKPLLKFDMGKIYGQYLGESEANLRKAIQVAESVSPAILWIDEIEKALAGAGGGGGDSGTSQRIFGTLLTWMEEKTAPVFVVATANQIDVLPPELLRKGRIDEIFFVDLPNDLERMDIFRVHLQKRNRDPNNFDLKLLVQKTDGFSGAEIEQVIIAALFDAFGYEEELTTEIVIKNIEKTVPLSKAMGDFIKWLREWAKDRCRFASRAGGHEPDEGGIPEGIDITGKKGKERVKRTITMDEE
ncbi:AAA family ATPase [bacterium]|nr:AAA family ATPase [bacterium]